MSADEISYPSARPRKSLRKQEEAEEAEPGQTTLLMYDTCAEISSMVPPQQPKLPYSGMPIVTGNKCNDNKLFIDEMPFWWSGDVADITDDELVMNASVLIDALEGRLKLVPMPDIQIVLDPIEDVTVLQTRDTQIFKKDIIFGNTVRSMVNLNELSIRSLQTSSRRSRKQKKAAVDSDQTQVLDMIEPTSRTMYSETCSFIMSSRSCAWRTLKRLLQ